jgi:N-acetylglucosaminyldiphosphoundecaprenol N-acetyl-beta-D-mannosaminyltransferase
MANAALHSDGRRPSGHAPDAPVPAIHVLGVGVHPLSLESLHEWMAQVITARGHELVLHANVHALNLASSEPWFRDFLNSAPVVFCDGAGVMLGARILGARIPERITYADWMWQLAALAAERDWSFYFLGARPGVAERAATQLRAQHPRLRVAGVQDGYFERVGAENDAVVDAINAAAPDILVVGLGMPLQEAWLRDNWERLDVPIALTGGAVFDYLSGTLRRAPRWMTGSGLEWLGRLAIEPRRLWRRYLLGNPLFLARVLRQRLVEGAAR